jgi:hypothetical protein
VFGPFLRLVVVFFHSVVMMEARPRVRLREAYINPTCSCVQDCIDHSPSPLKLSRGNIKNVHVESMIPFVRCCLYLCPKPDYDSLIEGEDAVLCSCRIGGLFC